jgi:hypothetical protein
MPPVVFHPPDDIRVEDVPEPQPLTGTQCYWSPCGAASAAPTCTSTPPGRSSPRRGPSADWRHDSAHALAASAAGAGELFIAEPNPSRAEFAGRLDIGQVLTALGDELIGQLQDRTDCAGVDLAIECAGKEQR